MKKSATYRTQIVSGLIGTSGTAPAYIGSFSGSGEFFNGSIDEFRLWDRALTPCEIQTTMNCEFISAKNGLVVYYNFNSGLAGAPNATIDKLADESDNNNHGTLTNFALTGTTSNWIAPGGVLSGVWCALTRVSIYVTSGTYKICANSLVTFIAVAYNGGNTPLYQWTKNGININGAHDSIFTTASLSNNDTIRCVLTNNTSCATPIVAYSNLEIMNVTLPIYNFIGSGNWDVASNWQNNAIPPPVLPSCSRVIIDPSANGECILNTPQIILSGATFTVQPGKKFRVLRNLLINDSTSTLNPDTTTIYGLGLVSATTAERENIPNIEDLDTSLIQPIARNISTQSSSIVNVPPPRLLPQIGGSCVAWALGYGILGFYNKTFENNSTYSGDDKITSPTFIYNQLNGNN